jgi:hypothetical protein
MNQEQRKYAMGRIALSAQIKKKEVEERFTKKRISDDEMVRLVRDGKVKLLNEVKAHTYLRYAFDFSKYETTGGLDEAKANPILLVISKASQSAQDNIMLADDAAALKAIKDFDLAMSKI